MKRKCAKEGCEKQRQSHTNGMCKACFNQLEQQPQRAVTYCKAGCLRQVKNTGMYDGRCRACYKQLIAQQQVDVGFEVDDGDGDEKQRADTANTAGGTEKKVGKNRRRAEANARQGGVPPTTAKKKCMGPPRKSRRGAETAAEDGTTNLDDSRSAGNDRGGDVDLPDFNQEPAQEAEDKTPKPPPDREAIIITDDYPQQIVNPLLPQW